MSRSKRAFVHPGVILFGFLAVIVGLSLLVAPPVATPNARRKSAGGAARPAARRSGKARMRALVMHAVTATALLALVGGIAVAPLEVSASPSSVSASAPVGASAPSDRPADYEIPGGHFFTQAGGGKGGYGVRDLAGVRFWSEYQRLGGSDALGYPISKPFWGAGGFLYQGFERGLLQWRPEWDFAVLANSIEMIEAHDKSRDKWLFEGYHIPYPRQPKKASFDEEATERLSWLTNDQIRAAYLSSPITGEEWDVADAANFYGLPQSEPLRSGPFIVQRFQRIPLQLWLDDIPGMPPPGSVVGILAGHLVKQAGLMPRDAGIPEPLVPSRAEVEEQLGLAGF